MRKPIDIIADALVEKVRVSPSGAKSLAHLLVIVPTAQSGRRLRLHLARRLGALVPPQVMMPAQLLTPDDSVRLATRGDELVAWWEVQHNLDIAAQLVDVRDILGANALSFADVAERIGDILTGELADVESARWKNLAELERRYLAGLERRHLVDRIVAAKDVIAHPPVLAGIEEVVLACVLDPLPAMRQVLRQMKLPVTELEIFESSNRLKEGEGEGLRRTKEGKIPLLASALSPSNFSSLQPPQPPQPSQPSNIFPFGTASSESRQIAEFFAQVRPDDQLPALCLADPDLFPEIQGALQAKGFQVHNPSSSRLVTSSLGHLAAQLAALVRHQSYDVFSAFVRGGDVRRWLTDELNLSEDEMTGVLTDLDNRQAQLLPEKIDDIAPKTKGKLRAVFEFVKVQLRKKTLRELLQAIFRNHMLDERDAGAREFAAAAETLNALIDEAFGESVPKEIAWELFARRLDEATYSLEPDEGNAVLTDGWLELPYLDADELVIAGFSEGRVPESVVGHAFLPDSLRRALGLPDNDSRARRDWAIFRMVLACRARDAVSVTYHAVDAQGNALKPSRLLFQDADGSDLIERVKAFYAVRAGTDEVQAVDLPAKWKLRLPVPPPESRLEHASPSSIDMYLKCPFTYYLKKCFGEREDDRAEELDPSEFGNLAHQALEKWGQGSLADSEDAEAISAELAENVDGLLGERFGTAIPAIVSLQGESLKRRLRNFATAQAEWHRAGWRIVATERKLEVQLDHTRLHGRCDRIDYNAAKGEWCVIDYKTWDSDERRGESLQLPLYCSMLDADPAFAEATRDHISSVYCVIGKTREDTGYGKLSNGATVPEAEARVRELIRRIERGIFWPPASTREWKWDFADWIRGTPEESVDEAWLADQLARERPTPH